jgi:hypothetical protein
LWKPRFEKLFRDGAETMDPGDWTERMISHRRGTTKIALIIVPATR